MCLLIVLSRAHSDFPLVMAANRDELLDRPAVPIAVLRDGQPRVLGGRDELGGGTWLAVNQFGVVAGLTNRPATTGRDPTKRSRGELPLALASHTTAAAAVQDLVARCNPADYNRAWLLVGDRRALFSVDMTGDDTVVAKELPPGIHILENRAPGAPSPKVDHVRALVGDVGGLRAGELVSRLRSVLADHEIPAALDSDPGAERPAPIRCACVHTERYGTRWSAVVTVDADPACPPSFTYADGPPCRAPFVDATELWSTAEARVASDG